MTMPKDQPVKLERQALSEQDRGESLKALLRDWIQEHGKPTAKDFKWAERALAPRRK